MVDHSADVVPGPPTTRRSRWWWRSAWAKATAGVMAVLIVAAGGAFAYRLGGQRQQRTYAPPNTISTVGNYYGPTLADNVFYVRALGSRCIDMGGQASWAVHSPVIIYGCNGSVAQQIRVHELDYASHDVNLMVPSATYCIGVAVPSGQILAPGQPLELQTCDGSAAQRFAWDGDSLLTGPLDSGHVLRQYVIEPRGDSTEAHTSLVVGERNLSDAEFFRMQAVDGSDTPPISGWFRAATEADLDADLKAGWGTVIEVTQSIALTAPPGNPVHQGVTLRGSRKFTDNGPELSYSDLSKEATLLQMEDRSRITGLRIRGPNVTHDTSTQHPYVNGIQIPGQYVSLTNVIVDHVEASDWPGTAIGVAGPADHDPTCYDGTYPRPGVVKIVGNFIHHNLNSHELGGGYAVGGGGVIGGGYTIIRGNTMYANRHSVTADGSGINSYDALDNLVLSQAGPEQILDVHGTCCASSWDSGTSGDTFNIGYNTFLGPSQDNITFIQRGTPCHYTFFHNDVSRMGSDQVQTLSQPPSTLIESDDQWSVPDPTTQLGVGDFDGDGTDDVFLATGNTWWYSSGGKAEWRFLNQMPDRVSDLRFGDFDGDGRTDVLALHGANLDVSWGGVSPWTTLTTTGASLSDIAVGDFDGDHRSDIFVATPPLAGFATKWIYASGGRTWTQFANMQLRTGQLRFGDFDGDGKTDVFFVANGQWSIIKGGTTFNAAPTPLRSALTSSTNGLVVADFDGDHHADVVRYINYTWQYSPDGTGDFTTLRSASSSQNLAKLPVGRFDGNATSDVLVWSGYNFYIAPSGRDPLARDSRQDMR